MRWTKRRILLACWAPMAILLLAFSVKVFVMTSDTEAGRSSYGTGKYDEAKRRFDATQVINIFEPWVAPYNQGTTLYQLLRYAEARTELEKSLTLVTPTYDCMVRLNLVATIEAQGDELMARQNAAEAKKRYDEALEVLGKGDCGTRDKSSASPSASGQSSQPSSKSPSPTKASSGQSSPGQSGQPTQGSGQPSQGSGQPTQGSGEPTKGPTSEAERKEQEEKRADEAEERIDDKSTDAQRQASQQARDASRASTGPASSKAPDTPEQKQEKEKARASQNASAQSEQQEGQDYDRRPSDRSTVDRPW